MSAFLTFGGGVVQQARTRYRAIALTTDITLKWPWINQDSNQIVAFINDVTPSGPGLHLTMPAANQAPVGFDALFFNIGADPFEVLDADGGAIVTVGAGLAKYVYLTDNGSSAGEWVQIQFGAGGSQADAASLAGFGLVALASRLHANLVPNLINDDIDLNDQSRAQVFVVEPTAGGGTIGFDPVGSLSPGWFVGIQNLGGSAWVLDPDGGELIDNQPQINLNPNESCFVFAGSTGLYTVGRGRTAQFAYTQNTKDVSGSTDVTLNATEAGSYFQNYTGVLTGNINVIVPNVVQPYVVSNNTSGAFTLTVKTAAGTGLIVAQGETTILHCNGTNVVDSDTIAPTPSAFQLPDGTAAAPGLAFVADSNLGFYRIGNDQLGIAANGQLVLQIDTTGINVPTNLVKQRGLTVSMLAACIG